jgi:hypothetical protein
MRKWQNMIKKNDKVEIGNILLKHVLPVYNLAPPSWSTYDWLP